MQASFSKVTNAFFCKYSEAAAEAAAGNKEEEEEKDQQLSSSFSICQIVPRGVVVAEYRMMAPCRLLLRRKEIHTTRTSPTFYLHFMF